MIFFAYLNIPISVAEMMQGALVFITTIASVFILKKKFAIYQWVSVFIIMGGIVLVGASSLSNKDDGTDGNPAFGIGLMAIAMCFQAAQLIIEEKLFRKYYLSPLKVVGFQGIFGIIIYLIFLPIAYFIK
mmetsp:Transcript_6908/g.6061  ORF Transcript_6908/g.6061 Transcript_6908/m.6061 type:complete len:130 (+) Transcript_6908:335-724(+)